MSNILLSSESNEKYTPVEILQAVWNVMGSIDLDPASNEKVNEIIKASRYFDSEVNGLDQEWRGKVFLNPPGGKTGNKSNAIMWFEKLLDDYDEGLVTEAIYLGFSLEQLARHEAFFTLPICFVHKIATAECVTGSGRIKFLDENLKVQASPTHSNFITYLPPHERKEARSKIELFASEFDKFGIVKRYW